MRGRIPRDAHRVAYPVRAAGFGLNDFEDALQLSAAESCQAEVILTRNKADFSNPPKIAVLTPEEF